jgi:hypothetical protein
MRDVCGGREGQLLLVIFKIRMRVAGLFTVTKGDLHAPIGQMERHSVSDLTDCQLCPAVTVSIMVFSALFVRGVIRVLRPLPPPVAHHHPYPHHRAL